MFNKKTIIISAIIIILILIVAGVYWFYSKKPAEERPAIISALFPFAGEKEIEGLPVGGEETGFPAGGERLEKKVSGERILLQLTSKAVSGAGLASSTLRYVERATGHIYEIEPNGQNQKRLSNTTILKTFESLWSPKANKLILRYFEENEMYPSVKNLLASISTTTQGIFLPQSITAVVVSPQEERIFYLVSLEGITRGIVADFENKKQNNIFSNSFGEFNISWPKSDLIALLTKPSADVNGFLYSLNPQNGSFSKIIGDLKGLTALVSPDGSRVIYSQSEKYSFNTKIFNLKDKQSSDFDLRTLPEKCVWSKTNKNLVYCAVPDSFPSSDYPDDWYQGLISFQDSIWQKNFSTGETIILMENTGLDVINPFLTQDENYLIFTNKNNNTLWSLKLK